MNNIYEDRKTCTFCVLSLVKLTKMPEIVLKFCKHWVLKFHFLLLGALYLEFFAIERDSSCTLIRNFV